MRDRSPRADGGQEDPVPGDVCDRYRALLDAIDGGIVRLDAAGRFVAVTDDVLELTGYDRETLLGSDASRLFEADSDDRLDRALDGDSNGDAGDWIDVPVSTAGGETVPCEVSVHRERGAGGDAERICVLRRAPDRGRGELDRERERELEQYRALTDAANDVIVTIDEASTIQTVNQAVEDVFGYDPDELMGKPLTALMPDDLAQRHYEGLANYVRTGERTLDWDYVELPGVRADGSEIPLAVSFSEVEHDGERYFTGIVRDVTDRERRERALEESERRYRTLVEHFPNGAVALVDEDRRYVTFGGTPEGDTDLTSEDLEGERLEDALPADLADVVVPRYEAALAGESSHFEASVDDSVYQFTFVPVRDETGDAVAAMGLSQDVTERRAYERKLEDSNERLEQFAYGASHDLQEPLRMISSYLQLIDDRYADDLDEDGREFLEFAVDGAERMREMIDALLAYSRIESGGDPLGPIDLDQVLDDVVADLRVAIDETDAEITREPLPTVEGDGNQLRQVLQNLVENAIAYSGDEPPRIHVAAERSGPEWVVAVSDEGVGIDPENQSQVFDVFERLDGHGDSSGTGVGLALCERIVERHGGDIWVESEPGEGATFSFTVPAADG